MNRTIFGAGVTAIPVIIAVLTVGCAATTSPAAGPAPVPTLSSAQVPASPSTPLATTTAAPSPSTAVQASVTPSAPSEGPALSITQPVANTYVVGTTDVTVKVKVTGFSLVDKSGEANVPGQGHIIYSIREDSPGPPLVTTPDASASSAATSYTWTGLIESQYTFSAELVNNDNTPLSPAVVVTVTVNVYPGG